MYITGLFLNIATSLFKVNNILCDIYFVLTNGIKKSYTRLYYNRS